MTENEKRLLMVDLCGRLPYGVKVRLEYKPRKVIGIVEDNIIVNGTVDGEKAWNEYGIEEFNIKPYLRPMTSMTEEEEKKYNILTPIVEVVFPCDAYPLIDWLNKHMFDYRGLIEKGLAIEAAEGMYDFA